MSDFIRARSDEQKCQRMAEIKRATDELFAQVPYHEITLTTIADRLGWSRANLYKYVTTKEEIFLELTADKRDAYSDALLSAFPAGCGYPVEVAAEVWAGIANAHQDFFRYGNLLYTIVETNVTLERLIVFKRGYYEGLELLKARFSAELGVEAGRVEALTNTVYHHAVGLSGSCMNNPLVRQAVETLGVASALTPIDFRAEMRDFIGMCLRHYRG